MSDQRLYTIQIREADQETFSNRQRKRVSSESTLTNDFGDVKETGSRPGAKPIRGAYKGTYADLMAKQLQELAQAGDYGAVPLLSEDENPKNDAYVTVDSFTVNPASPRNSKIELWEFDGMVTAKGTRRSHWRSVSTDTVSVDNAIGSGGNEVVGIPASATKVRWYDEVGQQLEDATATNTIIGRFADVETYNPADPSFDDPTLIFRLPYEDEGKVDARVWDDHDRTQTDANGINSWQKVFISGHNYSGSAVVENGLLQMELDEEGENLTFKEWDNANSTYSTRSLNASDWVLTDVNFTRISPARVGGQMRFRDTVSGGFHSLDFQVNRASNRVLFITPTNQSAIPAGLSTKLSPIAEDWDEEAQPVQGVLSRREVND